MIERLRGRLRLRSPEGDDARIRLHGYPGRGTVISVASTGRRRGNRQEVDLVLDVYLGRSRSFRVGIRPWVSDEELTRLRPGRAVPVAADHDEPGHVVLAFDMDEARSIAGLGRVAGGPGGSISPRSEDEPEDDR